jgi:hypothetical protein
MGAHYSSIQIRSEDFGAVKTAVDSVAAECRKKFLLAPPIDGWIGVFPDGSGNDEHCGALLAKKVGAIVLQLMVHDSDIFFYNFYRAGELLNEYSSDPDAFEEVSAEEHERLRAKPEIFRELVPTPERWDALAALLVRGEGALEFTVAEDRMERFAKILGIRNTLTSYEYLTGGEHDGIKNWKKFIHIPDLADEKAAKKAKAAALLAEKQRLHKLGLFCVECFPKGAKRRAANMRCTGPCFDPLDGSLLIEWWWHGGYPPLPHHIVRLQSPWTSAPEPGPITFDPKSGPAGLKFSRSGKWLAATEGGLKLWDWPRREPLAHIQYRGSPLEFSADEKVLHCLLGESFESLSLETGKVIRSVKIAARIESLTLHPSEKYLVTKLRQGQLGIINLDCGKLEKVLLCGGIHDWSALIAQFAGKLKGAGFGEATLGEWKGAFVRGAYNILDLKFSSDGSRLFCGTTCGVRAFAWEDLLQADEITPKPVYSVTTPVDTDRVNAHDAQYVNFVYDIWLDESQNRALFSGWEGVVRYLNLSDGTTGLLLDPPGKSSLHDLRISPDRRFLACHWSPPFDSRRDERSSVQVWNYQALCEAAGLAWS